MGLGYRHISASDWKRKRDISNSMGHRATPHVRLGCVRETCVRLVCVRETCVRLVCERDVCETCV